MAVCLVHAGPSDKTFPSVCLGEAPSADPLRIVIAETPESSFLLDTLLKTPGDAACAGDPGVYRVEGTETFVCGKSWRGFIADLAELTRDAQLVALRERLG